MSSTRIARLLQRHRTELSKVNLTPLLEHLVKNRVISKEEQQSVINCETSKRGAAGPLGSVDKLIEILPSKGFNAFREFCAILEMDCPHLLTSLVLDSTGKGQEGHL